MTDAPGPRTGTDESAAGPLEVDRHARIARRAYELHVSRGEGAGALGDWLEAETEIEGEART